MSDQPKEPAGTPGMITQAMLNIMSQVGAIGKDHKNQQQGYSFRGIEDFYNRLHPMMAKEGILTLPKILEIRETQIENAKGTKGFRVSVTIQYFFRAADGSEVDCIGAGEASDYGDKATMKAMSQAHKYALTQVFMIPTKAEGNRSPGKGQPPPAPEANSPEELMLQQLKAGLMKLVIEQRKDHKDMTDKAWIQAVVLAELGHKNIENIEELTKVKAVIDEGLYELATAEKIPF